MFDFLNGLDPAMTDLHSNFSEGMSVLFASLKQLQKKQAAMAPSDAQDVKPSASSERKLSAKMSAVGSPDFLDEDLGESPGFLRRHQKSQAKPMGTSGMPWNGGTRRMSCRNCFTHPCDDMAPWRRKCWLHRAAQPKSLENSKLATSNHWIPSIQF
jgi:hypothetical protein